jgi:hypothetical protein
MDAYLEALLSYEVAVPVWTLMLAWLSTFIATHLVVRATRSAFARQQRIAVPNDPRLSIASQPKYIAAQVLFAAVIFATCLALGGSFAAFFAGGLVVASAVALGLNYYGLMYARALTKEVSGNGQVQLSTSFAIANGGNQMLGGALACLILGLVLANLSLLGGVLFLGSTGIGYLRKAQSGSVRP